MPAATHITICEVGTRDGFQIEPEFIPTDLKREVVNRLSATALPRIEVTSFVHPKAVPQLRDAEEVMARIELAGAIDFMRQVDFQPHAQRLHGLQKGCQKMFGIAGVCAARAGNITQGFPHVLLVQSRIKKSVDAT